MTPGHFDMNCTQGHGFQYVLTFSYAIDGYTWRAQVRDKDTNTKAMDITCTPNTTAKTVTLTATGENTISLSIKTYKWALEQTDATPVTQEIINGDFTVKAATVS